MNRQFWKNKIKNKKKNERGGEGIKFKLGQIKALFEEVENFYFWGEGGRGSSGGGSD